MNSEEVIKTLVHAIRFKKIEEVREILVKNPEILKVHSSNSSNDNLPQKTRSYERSPLWEAMLGGHEGIVELLINFGADPNQPFLFEKKNKFFGLTFIQGLALQQSKFLIFYKNVAKTLIRCGANVNAYLEDPEQKTALVIAIEQGNAEYVDFLLNNHAKFNSQFFLNIFNAPKIKQTIIIKLLIEYGQLYDKSLDQYDLYYLHEVFSYVSKYPNLDIDVVEVTEIFIDSGFPVNDECVLGQTVVHSATFLKNLQLVSFLIKKGADVNRKMQTSTFPLYAATQHNDIDMIKLLLSNKADINAKSARGHTVLHLSCIFRYEKTIHLLIEKGADIFTKDNKGCSPFYYLSPWNYKKTDIPCINLMVKEVAKRIFYYNLENNVEDMTIHPKVQQLFQSCMKELLQMENLKFYPPYSYFSVLMFSKKIKKLAKLTKNKNFCSKFEKNFNLTKINFSFYNFIQLFFGFKRKENQCLNLFLCYGSELRKIWKKAILLRDRSVTVQAEMKMSFDNLLPDIVLEKLVDNLVIEDLAVQKKIYFDEILKYVKMFDCKYFYETVRDFILLLFFIIILPLTFLYYISDVNKS